MRAPFDTEHARTELRSRLPSIPGISVDQRLGGRSTLYQHGADRIMLISLAVVTVAPEVWISNLTDEDVAAFGRPQTTGFGSHLIRLNDAELSSSGLLHFERRDALLIRRGRTAEAVLFRAILGGRQIITYVEALVRPTDNVYWVTVGAGRQGNFEIGMRNGLWGVPEEHGDRIRDVRSGDKLIFYGRDVGFAFCEVRSPPFYDRARVWPDGEYPYRVRVTPPLKRNEANDFSSVYGCLLDKEGRAYRNAQAAGMAIKGRGGVFRPLTPPEVSGLLRGLEWQDTVVQT
jgi:hypothetical protein